MWHQVFDDALGMSDVVSVARVTHAHVGREPTRSELTAARRSAHSYAAGSNIRLLHVSAADGGATRRFLLLARADADLSNDERLEAIAVGREALPRRRGPAHEPQVIENLMAAIVKASQSARRVDVSRLEPGHAQDLAAELTEAIRGFRRLQGRLHRRSRVGRLGTGQPLHR